MSVTMKLLVAQTLIRWGERVAHRLTTSDRDRALAELRGAVERLERSRREGEPRG